MTLTKVFRCLLFIALTVPLCGFELLRTTNESVEEGNAQLGAKKYEEALEYYDKAARELPADRGVDYNRGIALQNLGRVDEARQAFLKGTTAVDPSLKQKSFFNLGNVLFAQEKFGEAADAFRHALRLDPKDANARWNLEVALQREEKKKAEEEEKQQQQQDQQGPQDKEQKQPENQEGDPKNRPDEKQNQENEPKNEPKEDEKQEKQDPAEQDQPKQQQQDERPKAEQRPKTAEQREIEQALDALDRNDKNVQRERVRMSYPRRRAPAKDW